MVSENKGVIQFPNPLHSKGVQGGKPSSGGLGGSTASLAPEQIPRIRGIEVELLKGKMGCLSLRPLDSALSSLCPAPYFPLCQLLADYISRGT